MRYFFVLVLVLAVPTVIALPVTSAEAEQSPTTSEVEQIPVSDTVLTAPTARGSIGPDVVETIEGRTFQTVGAQWTPGTLPNGAAVQVRARTEDGWTEWIALGQRDHAPDGDTLEGQRVQDAGSSASVWVGDSDALQVRYRGSTKPQGAKVVVVDGDRTSADGSVGSQPLSAAAAATGQPFIFSRAEWGADESLRTSKPGCATPNYNATVKAAFVHHTASVNGYTAEDVPRLLRNLYSYDVTSAGYCDIPYNYLVDAYGQIWEGRAGGIDRPVLSGATGGFNVDTTSASLIGNFDQVPPPSTSMSALERLLAWKLSLHHRDPGGTTQLTAKGGSGTTAKYADGTTVSFSVISGHRDAGSTACPGRYVYSLLPTVRQEAVRIMGAGLVNPAAERVARTLDTSGSVRVRAGLMEPGDWTLEVRAANGTLTRSQSGSGSIVDTTWLMTDAAGTWAPNGAYTLTLTSAAGGDPAVPWSVTVPTGDVRGSLDALSGSVGQASVSGWALITDSPASVFVEVTVDGAVAARALASSPRPDVAAAFPGYGESHGYRLTLPNLTPGVRSVCVKVVDPATAAKTTLTCASISVAATPSPGLPPGPPIGNVEAAYAGPGTVTVSGWALDPDTAESIPIQVWIGGVLAAYLPASYERADVATAFPGYGPAHGYVVTVPSGPGLRSVCVAAANVGAGSVGTGWGCRTVTVPGGSPIGNPEAITPGDQTVTVSGWAIDPDVVAPVPIQVWVDGGLVAYVPAAQSRPDVAAAFPAYGPAHGYRITVPVSAGQHSVCVAANNVGVGRDVLFRCGTVLT